MADPVTTAQIIPFPRRAAAPDPAPEPVGKALASLSQAMADQREAVAVWRNAVKQLSKDMQLLSENLSAPKVKFAKGD